MNTKQTLSTERTDVSRRHFLKSSTLVAAGAAVAPFAITAHAAPDDPIRIGLIGCGGRGSGAVLDALGVITRVVYPKSGYHTEDVGDDAAVTAKNVSVVALCDVFPDRLARCRDQLGKLGVKVPEEACFSGFDGYQKMLAMSDVNYVIQATPPHFRPAHVKAAIEAGKNVFMEKPAAVDAPGVRLILEAGELAKQKGLGIAAGTQRRHQKSYIETIKRLHDGAIGDIVYGRCYWNGGVIWVIERKDGWSDMEWQLRNWNYFTWAGGDHVVEQHVHNLDVMSWVMGRPPARARALGGRQARPNRPEFGQIYDHFAIEFEYDNGAHIFTQTRQMDGTEGKVEEAVMGTKGSSNCANYIGVKGGESWKYRDASPSPYQQEHQNLIASIRAGQPINEAKTCAESTLMGIMGRESAYSGQTIEWNAALNAKKRLGPEKYELGPLPFPEVAIPGKYRLS